MCYKSIYEIGKERIRQAAIPPYKKCHEAGDLERNAAVANFATTAAGGRIYRGDYYNLAVFTSVGYRVKSLQGTRFHQLVMECLKEHSGNDAYRLATNFIYRASNLISIAVKTSALLLRRSNEHLRLSHDGGEISALIKVNSPAREDFSCDFFPNML